MDAAHTVRRPLGQILVEEGFITPEQLAHALEQQSETQGQLGELLVRLGYISQGVVANALAEQYGGLLKTEYGISAGFGGERRPEAPTVEEPVAPAELPPDLLAAWRDAVEQRDALIARFRGELDSAATAIGELEADRDRLAAAADDLRSTPSASTVDAGRVAELEAVLASVQAERDELGARVAELAAELEAGVGAREQELAHIAAANAKSQQLQAQLDARTAEHQAKVDELEAGFGAREEELAHVAAANARGQQLQAQLDARTAEHGGLQAKVEELEAALERAGSLSEQLQARLDARTAEHGGLQAKVEELEAALERAGSLSEQLRAEESQRADLERRLDELEQRPPPAATGGERVFDEHAHLLYVATPAGYLLVERPGPPPARGERVELDGAPSAVVTRIGRSPFPGSTLACVYLG